MKERAEEDSGDDGRKMLERRIQQWNSRALALFTISRPDQDSVFHGVIRFHLEGESCATRCLCVSSTCSARDATQMLLQKLQPEEPRAWCMYELLHQRERKMAPSEKPLLVQLSWRKTHSEGRFVLRTDRSVTSQAGGLEGARLLENLKKPLSRRETAEEQQSRPVPRRGGAGRLPLSISLAVADLDAFLCGVISHVSSVTAHFPLSPAYALYLAARCLSDQSQRSSIPPMFQQVSQLIHGVINEQRNVAAPLVFWMANSSELLSFIQRDRDLSSITSQAQRGLAPLVHRAFRFLTHRLQDDLRMHLPAFSAEAAQPSETMGAVSGLQKIMGLLRRCGLNPALSIQIFSQLFHFMGSWLLNQLTGAAPGSGLCSPDGGRTLLRRLRLVEAWAERQGLELAVDCHLSRVVQAAMLLTTSRVTPPDARTLQSACYKLNSAQLRALMSRDQPHQPGFPPGVVQQAVALAEASADRLGGGAQLEEELDLRLPFLLPEDGYSCDSMTGVPPGFQQFLEPICRRGVCALTADPSGAGGSWTVFLERGVAPADEVVRVTLRKRRGSGLGLSIVAARGPAQETLGIFIRSTVPGAAADQDGRLTAGDQIVCVNGRSLMGVTQEKAAEMLLSTGPLVILEVFKNAAVFYGFDGVFSQQPPTEGHQEASVSPASPDTAAHSLTGEEPGRATHHVTLPSSRWVHQSHQMRDRPEQWRSQDHLCAETRPDLSTWRSLGTLSPGHGGIPAQPKRVDVPYVGQWFRGERVVSE